MSSSKKRTRISRGQSKFGCFTCRARKIKCDEAKPSCLKCQQAKFVCEGYPSAAFKDQESTDSGQSSYDQEDVSGETSILHWDPENRAEEVTVSNLRVPSLAARHRLASVGLNLLLNSYSDEHVVGQYVLRRLITDHAQSYVAVNIACAALGAATEFQQRDGRPEDLKFALEEHYGQAMALVKQDIGRSDYDSNAILTACIVLASVETVLWRRQDATKHLSGAYQVFHLSRPDHRLVANAVSPSGSRNISTADIANADIDLLLRAFDISTMKFMSHTRAPIIPPLSLQILESSSPRSTINSVNRMVICILHASSAFITKSMNAALEGFSVHVVERERKRYVYLLHHITSHLTSKLEDVSKESERVYLMVLRNLCLAATLELKAGFTENETAWDLYTDVLRQIITSAELVVRNVVAWRARSNQPDTTDYTPQISTIQPLYLAALKYRDKRWRQRAIAALRLTGREGPWIGEMMAAIAERVTDLEELLATTNITSNTSSDIHHFSDADRQGLDGPEYIPELSRIAHVGIIDDSSQVSGVPWPMSNSGTTALTLLRRRQPSSILGPILFTSAHSGTETFASQLWGRQLDTSAWEVWDERIEFGPGVRYRVLTPANTISQVTSTYQ